MVPRSPRAPLLGYRERHGLPIADLVAAAIDPRCDVKDVALTSLRGIAATDTLDAEQLAHYFLREILDADTLVKLLDCDAKITRNFSDALLPLLDHESPEWRLAALYVVKKTALTTDQKQPLVARLLADPSEEVCRQAELIHSHLDKQTSGSARTEYMRQ